MSDRNDITITADVDRVRVTARIKTTVKNGYEPGDMTVELEAPDTSAIDMALHDGLVRDYFDILHLQAAAACRAINGKVNADG